MPTLINGKMNAVYSEFNLGHFNIIIFMVATMRKAF